MIKEVAATVQFLETSRSDECLFFSCTEAFCNEKGCIVQCNKQTNKERIHSTTLHLSPKGAKKTFLFRIPLISVVW
jgi:hypothetical protein